MRYSYKTQGVCSAEIQFDLEGDVVSNVRFIGGCPGNTQAVARLVDGMTAEQISQKVGGIRCGNKPTSCADQLAKAVVQAVQSVKQ